MCASLTNSHIQNSLLLCAQALTSLSFPALHLFPALLQSLSLSFPLPPTYPNPKPETLTQKP